MEFAVNGIQVFADLLYSLVICGLFVNHPSSTQRTHQPLIALSIRPRGGEVIAVLGRCVYGQMD